MKKLSGFVAPAVFFTLILAMNTVLGAEEFADADACRMAVKETEEAITENPGLTGKAAEILIEVMALADQRCDEQQFSNAKQLLDLARGMVASE